MCTSGKIKFLLLLLLLLLLFCFFFCILLEVKSQYFIERALGNKVLSDFWATGFFQFIKSQLNCEA